MALGKKGSITDLPFIVTGVFTFAIVAILVAFLVDNINTRVQDNDVFTTKAKTASSNMNNDFPTVVNTGIVFVFFGMCLISLILASLVPIHPVFLVFYFFEWIILIWLGGGIANAYQKLIELNLFSTQAAQFEAATFLFQYLPYVIMIVGALLAVVVYKTKQKFMIE